MLYTEFACASYSYSKIVHIISNLYDFVMIKNVNYEKKVHNKLKVMYYIIIIHNYLLWNLIRLTDENYYKLPSIIEYNLRSL